MYALEFHGRGDLRLVNRDAPVAPRADQVVLRPTLAGICGTDRAIYLGRYPCTGPRVLGHEAIGFIEAVGDDVVHIRPGDRVILDPTQSCSACRRCQRGDTNHCLRKRSMEVGVGRDGAFCEVLLIEAVALQRLPDDLPDQRAVLIEPLACVLNAMNKSALGPSDRVVVVGGGPIGILVAAVAQRFASSVVAVETDSYRQALLNRVLGVEITDLREQRSADIRPTLVVDTAGMGCEQLIQTVEDGGRICLMSCGAQLSAEIRPVDLAVRCLSLIGSCDYNRSLFPVAVDFMRTLRCDELITEILPLASYRQAFSLLATEPEAPYHAGKVLFAINQ